MFGIMGIGLMELVIVAGITPTTISPEACRIETNIVEKPRQSVAEHVTVWLR